MSRSITNIIHFQDKKSEDALGKIARELELLLPVSTSTPRSVYLHHRKAASRELNRLSLL
jgi:hypothetical protein